MEEGFLDDTFADGFSWGVATASYQIEGGHDADGKGVSIWDTFAHAPDTTHNGENGDVACDSYNKYMDDVAIIKELGLNHYRFSIAWSRIIPTLTSGVNQAGIAYYDKVIDALLEAGVQPMVTLYHWDLPQYLQDMGGWPNADLVKYFTDYARACFKAFGDRVKTWITFNEPFCACWYGYGNGSNAPGICDPLNSPFKAGHTMLRAHAAAYHLYDEEFRSTQHGRVGLTLNTEWFEPMDPNNPLDVQAAERLLSMRFGWFSYPILGPDGDYPAILKQQLAETTHKLGAPNPLPEFSTEEKYKNKNTVDFLGVNYYTCRLITPFDKSSSDPTTDPSGAALMGAVENLDNTWQRGASTWLYSVPWGFRKLLNWVKDTFNNPFVYVTENGVSDNNDGLDDPFRIEYLRNHVNQVLKAIKLDGCNIHGYTAWTLMDNFEWEAGYSRERFGLYYVDFADPDRKRVAKSSARVFAEMIKNNGFPHQKPV